MAGQGCEHQIMWVHPISMLFWGLSASEILAYPILHLLDKIAQNDAFQVLIISYIIQIQILRSHSPGPRPSPVGFFLVGLCWGKLVLSSRKVFEFVEKFEITPKGPKVSWTIKSIKKYLRRSRRGQYRKHTIIHFQSTFPQLCTFSPKVPKTTPKSTKKYLRRRRRGQ